MNKQQPYDSSLKALLQEDAAKIIPHLLQGAVFVGTMDVELLPPARRADRVFLVQIAEQRCIMDVEIESSADSTITSRLLAYNSYLYHKHQLPIVSMLVYPFEVKSPESPLVVSIGTRDLLTFHFTVVPLFRMQAHQYVQQHAIEMYALLPTMQGFDVNLLAQALEEMQQAYQSDEAKLARQLLWMGILLQRSSTISPETKQEIRRRFSMYDKLLEEDPRVIEMLAEREARGIIEGEAKGKMKGKAELVTTLIQARFPELVEEARRKLPQVTHSEDLDRIAKLIVTAPDANSLRWALDSMVA